MASIDHLVNARVTSIDHLASASGMASIDHLTLVTLRYVYYMTGSLCEHDIYAFIIM